ncbi:MAG: zinc metalloprotease HtpX [Omnitrophica WOR_2 bacterium GWA2_47_8]|nr:MAG: zinc metalloprotease HtpX [Omnitrophica WOR_2 bacterium GWA2_47_8]
MATLYTHQSENITKTWALLTGFFVFVIGLGLLFSQVYGNSMILYIAVVISLLMNIGSYWYSDKLVLSMVHAKPVTRDEYVDLWNIVENLAITAGLPMPALYIVEDPSPNAFATGRNKEHAAIAVHTGLLKILNKTELEGVLAHELSHVGNRDTLVSTVVVVLAGMIALMADMFLRISMFGGGRSRDREGGGNMMFVIAIVAAILAPIAATMIRLAVSRKREFLADASGALLTRYPEGLASALEKISAVGHVTPSTTASNAYAHLYISNPFNGTKGFMTGLFMTHPPAEERIAILRGMDIS